MNIYAHDVQEKYKLNTLFHTPVFLITVTILKFKVNVNHRCMYFNHSYVLDICLHRHVLP